MIRVMTQWIPVIGGLTTALIGALAVLLRARSEMAAKGNWERIKLLQEISERLAEDDLRSWIDQYTHLLIRSTAISSTRVKVGRFYAVFVPAGTVALAGGCIGLAGVVVDSVEITSIATIMFWAGLAATLLCMFIPLAPDLLPGVPRKQMNGELLALRKDILNSYTGVGRERGTTIASDMFAAFSASRKEKTESAGNEQKL